MAGTFSTVMARPVPVVAGLMALGAVLAFLEMGTPAALAFMVAGLVMMYAYGRNARPQ
ncbi:hypothetical protein JMJ56_08465 [Belnapia sp. T18]|uniref:Uncharacterized protein n=1 Tax=Belnapia arida TaxID=2804533 RepID=A0ABS1U022_9PROT|nr:hypothetical protein [Belnapia arida]MBL6078036.1 hypothetical protein [Belnapia arida]